MGLRPGHHAAVASLSETGKTLPWPQSPRSAPRTVTNRTATSIGRAAWSSPLAERGPTELTNVPHLKQACYRPKTDPKTQPSHPVRLLDHPRRTSLFRIRSPPRWIQSASIAIQAVPCRPARLVGAPHAAHHPRRPPATRVRRNSRRLPPHHAPGRRAAGDGHDARPQWPALRLRSGLVGQRQRLREQQDRGHADPGHRRNQRRERPGLLHHAGRLDGGRLHLPRTDLHLVRGQHPAAGSRRVLDHLGRPAHLHLQTAQRGEVPRRHHVHLGRRAGQPEPAVRREGQDPSEERHPAAEQPRRQR